MNWVQRQTMTSSSKVSTTTTLKCATVVQYGDRLWKARRFTPRQELGDTCWSKLEDHEIYFGTERLPRAAWTPVCGNITILPSQERPDHDLQERVLPFSCKCRVVVEHVDSLRSTLTLRFPVAFIGTGFSERHVYRKMFGMQETVCPNLQDNTTSASMPSVHDSIPRPIPSTRKPQARRKRESEIDEHHDQARRVECETRYLHENWRSGSDTSMRTLCTGRTPTYWR